MPEGAAALAKLVRAIVGQRLDIFVSNAGISKAAAVEEHSIEDFDNLFATNVRSPFFLVKELLPLFREGSSLIVVSYLAARGAAGNPGQPGAPSLPAYDATKGALETLVKHWAGTLGPRGIRVDAVAPGVIETDMSHFTKTEADRGFTLAMQALKRIGQPSDVADVIAFLASDAARCITGASIPVDGGSKL
jgi:NAD(P)-dependent dehydrogenase (short-subunit alcohol dehydrogenase family)